LGVGISLTEVDPGQQRQLEQLLSILAGESPLPTPPKPAVKTAEAVSSSDPVVLIEAIHRFFDKNKALTREEFTALAMRCRKKSYPLPPVTLLSERKSVSCSASAIMKGYGSISHNRCSRVYRILIGTSSCRPWRRRSRYRQSRDRQP